MSRSRASRAAVILAAVAAAGLCSGYPPGHGRFHRVSEAQAQAKRCAAEPAAPGTGAPAPNQTWCRSRSVRSGCRASGKSGVVEFRPVRDDIRTVGDIEADETRLSDVQIRFAGWVQKVYADATYKQVRQGQPLLTIYSPDLVTAEQDHLGKPPPRISLRGAHGAITESW